MLYPSPVLPCLLRIAKSLRCLPSDAAVLVGGAKLRLQIVPQLFGGQSPWKRELVLAVPLGLPGVASPAALGAVTSWGVHRNVLLKVFLGSQMLL